MESILLIQDKGNSVHYFNLKITKAFISFLFLVGSILPFTAFAQLNQGDLAFTSFNADEDGWCITTFVDIPANTIIYFSDGTATSPTAIGTTESAFRWETGPNVLYAGSVIRFSAIDNATLRSVSFGTFTATGNVGISASSETIYAFEGTSFSQPTTILTAVSSEGSLNSLTVAGLTPGTNATKLTPSTDFAEYTGARSGQSSFTDYKTLIFNPANWTIDGGGDGSAFVPNTTSFTIATGGAPTVGLMVSTTSGTETATTVITVSAVASSAVSGDQTVAIRVGGTGITTGDYTLSNMTITIASGMTTGSVNFTITDDADVEGTEAATLSISNPSSGLSLGTTVSQMVTITDNDVIASPSAIDLSTYVRIGRYNLPVPIRTPGAGSNLLGVEVSTITYSTASGTLFLMGDGATSIVEVGKNGVLISTMTLTAGNFVDTEGISHVSGNQFVMVEERVRQAHLFTYVAGGSLSTANVQSVKLGTTIGNIGLEGISYDPKTGGYILVKENSPQGIFQTGIDFGAGTATNGSPSTVNSTDLFSPSLAGLTDIADVYALSNLPSTLSGDNILILSQEDGKVININRTGSISSVLTITSDLGNPLNVSDQGNEGVTMDSEGLLYIVNEQGGGDANHPQLWVYAPSTYVYANQAPIEVSVANPTNSLPENTTTTSAIKIGNIIVSDDALGTNTLTLTGTDAAFFELVGNGLFLKAGTMLDFETKSSYSVTINVDDASIGNSPDATRNFILTVTDVQENATPPTVCITEVAPWSSGNSPGVGADWFEVTNKGTSALTITGWKFDDNSNSFASAVALNGITTIAPGQSVIFIEGDASKVTAFVNVWFGGTRPSNVLIGTYTGAGIGLSTSADAVNLFDANGALQASVTFGASPSSAPFATFDNAACNATVSTLSTASVNGGFSISDGAVALIGSPGSIANPVITHVSSSQNASSTIYPNPAANEVTIGAGSEEISSVTVRNVLGNEVIIENNVHGMQVVLDVAALSSGVYFVEIVTVSNKTITTKLRKE